MKTLRRPILVLGGVLAIGLAGCGDGGEDPAPATEDTAEQDAGAQDDPAEEDTVEEAATAEPEATADETAAAASFTGPSEPVRVTYRMTSDSETEEVTMAWDLPRYALLYEEGRMIFTADETIVCDAAGEGCFLMGSGTQGGMGSTAEGGFGAFLAFASGQAQEELPGATVSGETEIAGRSATCTTYDAEQYDSSLQGEGEFCYGADDGVLLRWSATDNQATIHTIEAIEVDEPEPSDFEPTGPVQEMPGMGGQDG